MKEKSKIDIAIDRLKEFEPPEGYYVAISGGKDSDVILKLCELAGVKFDVHHQHTTADAPQTVYYVRDIKECEVDKPKKSMWQLIAEQGVPPTRRMRYCCDVLKERTGEIGDTVYIGVRASESNNRKQLGMVTFYKDKNMIRPIFNWTDEEIWSYIIKNNLPYNPLYDQGWDRIGCIGCPLNSKSQKKELSMNPKYQENYLRAFGKMLEYRKSKGMETQWKTPEDVMKWWIGECKKQDVIDGQCSMFGD